MTTIEASWRARWKAIAKYYRALYFAPVTADCPQAGQRAQVTNFCANCEATERHSAALQAERDRAQADAAALRDLVESLSEDTKCRLDHNGHCQEHNWFSTKERCANARACELLATPNPGESLLAELAAARTEITTLKQAIQRYQSACEREIRASVQEMLQSGEQISNDIGDAAEAMFSLASKEA